MDNKQLQAENAQELDNIQNGAQNAAGNSARGAGKAARAGKSGINNLRNRGKEKGAAEGGNNGADGSAKNGKNDPRVHGEPSDEKTAQPQGKQDAKPSKNAKNEPQKTGGGAPSDNKKSGTKGGKNSGSSSVKKGGGNKTSSVKGASGTSGHALGSKTSGSSSVTGAIKSGAKRTAQAAKEAATKTVKHIARSALVIITIFVIVFVVLTAALEEGDNCGGGALDGNTVEGQIYNFIKSKGFDDLHIACMMGVMYGESRLDPTAIETVYDEPFTIGPKKQRIASAEFSPSAAAVAGYGARYPKIKRLGVGLAQWTDTTDGATWNSQLRRFAKNKGQEWHELSLQLEFWWCTINKEANKGTGVQYMMTRRGYSYDDFVNANSIETGCRLFMKGYEGILNSTLSARITKAKEYYSQIRAGSIDSGSGSGSGTVAKGTGKWTHPCPAHTMVSSGFGPRWGTTHKGIDFAAPKGTPIYAADSGKVTISKFSSTAGYYCAIDHGNGYVTKYMHQWKMPSVKVGDKVKAGQKIGEVGTTGQSTGNHLHFQVEKNGTAIDPAPLLKGASTSTSVVDGGGYDDCGDGTGGTVAAGVAGTVNETERMKWLFPSGVPTSESEMAKYLVRVRVPITNEKGKSTTMTLTVHKKLASEIKAAFEDMKAAGFKVKPGTTGAYSWRKQASGTGAQSHHSYGVCVDINAGDNPATYTEGKYDPKNNPYSIPQKVVKIWKSHGFYWGGDWSGHFKDYMHMTYTNH